VGYFAIRAKLHHRALKSDISRPEGSFFCRPVSQRAFEAAVSEKVQFTVRPSVLQLQTEGHWDTGFSSVTCYMVTLWAVVAHVSSGAAHVLWQLLDPLSGTKLPLAKRFGALSDERVSVKVAVQLH
jgi:hypothetical protein